MRILFTGASSFTGMWFVTALAARGHSVVAAMRSEERSYSGLRAERLARVAAACRTIWKAPFGSPRFLDAIAQEGPFDVLCHHGAETSGYKPCGNRGPAFNAKAATAANTNRLAGVLHALKDGGCRRIVLTGSIFEADEGAGTTPLHPFSPYGISKTFTSKTFQYCTAQSGLALGKFVIPNPFGPYEEARFTDYLIRCWREGKPALVKTPQYVRDNIHVSLLTANYCAFVETLPEEGFHKTNPSGYAESQGAFAGRFAREIGKRLKLETVLELTDQIDFSEPLIRINTDVNALPERDWDEHAAWNELADYYARRFDIERRDGVNRQRGTGHSPSLTVGVAVITYRAASLLQECLPPLLASALRPRLLVVNSSSNDGTVEVARQMGASVLIVQRHQFNHGVTREIARRTLGTDIVVMMTPDAKPLDPGLLERLVRPIVEGKASVTYARQIPRDGAGFFEAFSRHFNYPDHSELRSIGDATHLGPQTFFCSNVCAAWSSAALDSIGGFSPTLSLEDTIATIKLLNTNHRIAYCADAVVRHSHDYTLVQEFRRHFDTGYVRAEHRNDLLARAGDERRGVRYASAMLARLWRERPFAIPYALANLASKYLGYRLGFHGRRLPLWLKRRVSAQDYYWQDATAPPTLDPIAEPRAST